jgi:pantoate--beta-alanine ligase
MQLEYFLIADEETLKETFFIKTEFQSFYCSYVDGVRLIDNMHKIY